MMQVETFRQLSRVSRVELLISSRHITSRRSKHSVNVFFFRFERCELFEDIS